MGHFYNESSKADTSVFDEGITVTCLYLWTSKYIQIVHFSGLKQVYIMDIESDM